MKITSRAAFTASLCASVLTTAAVVAQPPEGRRGGPGGPGGSPEMMMRMMPVLAALDADKDGTISKAEIDNASAALRTLDKNNDGKLSNEEMRPNFAAMGDRGGRPEGGRPEGAGGGGRPEMEGRGNDRGQFMTQMFETRDANKDGKLVGDEIPEQMAGRLKQLDTDGDGAISKQEMGAMMQRMREGGGGRPGGDRGGEPGGDRPKRPAAE